MSGPLSPWLTWLIDAGQWVFLVYFIGLSVTYIGLNMLALRELGRDAAMPADLNLPGYGAAMAPGISLIAPAYNEEANIAASVRSMLQLDYPDIEIIVVNDGSRDQTLAVLQREFELQAFPVAYRVSIPVEAVRGIYRSARHPQLLVIDKANGGKADALNAGINAARHDLFCAVDADSVLQRDSLRRIARPFLEDHRVVACGGTIRIANGCVIEQGFLRSVGVPHNLLARIQVTEYLRAFLFGRLGWAPLNALLIISGAFGLFRRSAVVAAGGYRRSTIGEDMELVARMHRLGRETGSDYRIAYVPDPVCWTEAPESLAVLRAQRVRWQRGLLESLWLNRGLLFSRRGGLVGWLAFPVMLLFEALGPAIELIGLALMAVAAVTGLISPEAFLTFIGLAVALGLMLSASALLMEEMSFHLYPKWSQLLELAGAILIENLGYRQINSWWRLKGTWLWLRGRPAIWGDMQRKGVGR